MSSTIDELYSLAGDVAVVTGAGRGIDARRGRDLHR